MRDAHLAALFTFCFRAPHSAPARFSRHAISTIAAMTPPAAAFAYYLDTCSPLSNLVERWRRVPSRGLSTKAGQGQVASLPFTSSGRRMDVGRSLREEDQHACGACLWKGGRGSRGGRLRTGRGMTNTRTTSAEPSGVAPPGTRHNAILYPLLFSSLLYLWRCQCCNQDWRP